ILMTTFADDCTLSDENATAQGIGAGEAGAFAGQSQGVLHEASGVRVHSSAESSVEKRIRVGFRVKGHHVVNLLAGADETNGQAELARDRDDNAALGGAIEFRQDDPRYGHSGSK